MDRTQKTSLQAVVKILIILLLLSFSACSTPVTPIALEPEPAAPSIVPDETNEESPSLEALLNEAEVHQPLQEPESSQPVSVETAFENPSVNPEQELKEVKKQPIYLSALDTRQKAYSLTASFLDRKAVTEVISLPKSIGIAVTGGNKTFSVTVSSESTRAEGGETGSVNSLNPSAAHAYIKPVSVIKVLSPVLVKQISPAHVAVQHTTPSLVQFNLSLNIGTWLALAIAVIISGTAAIFIPGKRKKESQ